MPGFGDADKPEDFPYTIEGYAAHLDGALRQLGIEKAHLIVHDFGGPWGLQWAVDHPDAYASTTLVDTGILYGYSWHAFAKVWRTRGLGELFFAITTRSALRVGAETRSARRPCRKRRSSSSTRPARTRAPSGRSCAFTAPARRASLEPLGAAAAGDEPARPLVVWGAHDPYIKVELRRAAAGRRSPTPRSSSSRKAATGRCGTRRRRSRRRSSPSSPGSSAPPPEPRSGVQLELVLADPHVVARFEAGGAQGGDDADLVEAALQVGERLFVVEVVALEEQLDAAAEDAEAAVGLALDRVAALADRAVDAVLGLELGRRGASVGRRAPARAPPAARRGSPGAARPAPRRSPRRPPGRRGRGRRAAAATP